MVRDGLKYISQKNIGESFKTVKIFFFQISKHVENKWYQSHKKKVIF